MRDRVVHEATELHKAIRQTLAELRKEYGRVTPEMEKWVKAKSIIERLGFQLIEIGVATEERSLKLEIDGEEFPIEPRGWEHFNS